MTQRQLKTLRQQMNLDPTRFRNIATAARLTNEQITLTAQKMATLRTALSQLGNEKLDKMGGSVKEIADQTQNATTKAASLHTEYNRIDNVLENVKNDIRQLAKTNGIRLVKKNSAGEMDKYISQLKHLNVGQNAVIASAARFGIGLGKLKSDADALSTKIDTLSATYRKYKSAHDSVQESMGEMDKIADFQRLRTEIELVNNELRQQAVEWVKLREKAWAFSDGTKPKMDRLKVTADELEREFHELDNALKLNPNNIHTVDKLLRNAYERAKVCQEQIGLVQQKLANMRASGVERTSESFSTLSVRLQKNIERLTVLGTRVNKVSAEIERATAELTHLDEGTDEFNKLSSHIEKCKNTLAVLGREFNKVDAECNTDHAQKEYRELETSLEALMGKSESLRREQDALRESAAGMNASSAYQKVRADVEATTAEIKKQSAEWVKLRETAWMFADGTKPKMDRLKVAGDELENEFHQLEEAMKIDPKNVSTAAQMFRNASERAKVLREQIELVQSKLRSMNASGVKRTSESFSTLSTRLEKTKLRLESVRTRISQVERAMERTREEMNGFSRNSSEWVKLNEKVRKCEETVNKLRLAEERLETQAKTDRQQKEVRELETEITTLNSKLIQTSNLMRMDKGVFSGMASNLKSLGMTLFSTLTPAAMMIGTYAITAADEVDAAYRNMRKTVQGTDEQFEQLKQDAIEFSETHFTSADQLLEIEAIGGQLGIAAENLGTFAEVVSSLDIATNLDTEQAATQLGQLNGIMADLTEDKFSNFADALVRLGNNSPTLESNIMDVTLRLASMSQTIGMSTPDVLAWSTAIAATGQKSEAAGTAIAKTFSNIETAVAGGGDILTAFADVAKMSAEDFAATWESNPTEALKAFIKGLRDIQDAGGSVDGTLEDLKITGVRQKQAIDGLVQTIDMMDSSLEMSNDAWDGVSDQWGRAGDAAREADRKSEGFSGTMQKLRNNAQELAMNMGESLTPILNVALSLLKRLNDVFMSLPSGTRTVITAILAAAAGFGPMLTMLSTTMTMYGNLTSSARTARVTLQAINKVAAKAGGIEKLGIVVAKTGEAFDAATMSMDGNIIKSRESGRVLGKAAISNGKYARSVRVMSAAMKAFSTAGIIAGIAAAAIVVSVIVKKIADATKKARTFKQIQKDLATANLNTSRTLKGNSEAFDDYISSASRVKDASKEAADGLQSLSDTASNINRTLTENQADVSSLEHYGKIIEELLPNTERTAEEQAKLEDAVAHVNSITGESLQTSSDWTQWLYNEGDGAWYTVDALKGEYQAIEDLIDAKQREMEAEAFRQAQSEVYQEEIDARRDYAEALNEQVQLEQEARDLAAQRDAGTIDYETYNTELAENVRKQAELADTLATNKDRADAAAQASRSYADAAVLLEMASSDAGDAIAEKLTEHLWDLQPVLAENGESMLDFRNTLANAGIDTEAFASKSDDELIRLAASYDGTFDSIDELLDEYGISYDAAAAEAADASATMRNELERVGSGAISAFEEANGPIEDFITALQNAGVSTEDLAALTPEKLQLVLDSYDGTIESVTGILDEFKRTAQTKGTEGGKKYAYGIGLAESSARTAGSILSTAAKMGLEDVDIETVGLNFAKGYARGISSGQINVTTAVKELVKNTLAAANEAQDSGSPSRIMYKVGQWFSQGYALGITSEMKNVAKSATAMSQTAIDNVAGVMDYMDSPEFSQAVSFRTVSADDVYNSTLRAINDSGGMGIYLDGDVLVGRTAKRMDAALGSRRSLAGRGIG